MKTRSRKKYRIIRLTLTAIGILVGGSSFVAPIRAEYSEQKKDLINRHLNYGINGLGFGAAPIVAINHLSNRDSKIRELTTLISDINGEKGKLAFDADLVIATRADLLKEEAIENHGPKFKQSADLDDLRVIESENKTTLIRQSDFHLTVFRDGTAFRLINYRNNFTKYNNAPAKYAEVDADKIGRDIIRSLKLIPEKDMEQLLFLETRYTHFTGSASDPGDRVVSTEIVFGRQIGGVPVIGDGSKIRLGLIAGKEVRSVTVDWPSISITDQVQQPVSYNTFLVRLAGSIKIKALKDNYINESAAAMDIGINENLCGYIDPGSRYVNANIMSLACQVVYQTDEDTSSPDSIIVPIGQDVYDIYGDSSADKIQEIDDSAKNPSVTVQFVEPVEKTSNN